MIKKISIIIPVFNAENSIENLVEELIDQISENNPIEIILINDCSADESEKKCINLYEKYSDLIITLSLAKNVGEHNAVMAGLNYMSGDYALIMDDDSQNPVSEVKKLIAYAEKSDYDVIYTFYSKKFHSLFRNLGSIFNNFVASIMLKKPRNLYLSSFKIMNSFIAKEIIKYDLPYSYIDGLILRTTENIGTLEVDHHPRAESKSGYTIRKLVSLWLNMFTNFSILPLRVAIITGFIFSFLGILLGLQTIIERLNNPDLPAGYALLITTFAIFSGIQLISIGMVGEYLGRMFLSQNKKPQFTVRKEFFKK
ncbi:glycosyltransferase [Gammaproteobacteria bacterium]|jgi:glycosyltransferase involved in cell wall biosynthesis|nr:glycosyltransferase [Gammaproteobacteria bacterium]